jgi:hypothetical protein
MGSFISKLEEYLPKVNRILLIQYKMSVFQKFVIGFLIKSLEFENKYTTTFESPTAQEICSNYSMEFPPLLLFISKLTFPSRKMSKIRDGNSFFLSFANFFHFSDENLGKSSM